MTVPAPLAEAPRARGDSAPLAEAPRARGDSTSLAEAPRARGDSTSLAEAPRARAPLAEALRARGHRVTAQRVVLHEALSDLGRHATAEELARAAGPKLPGLSLPTVYATLDLFAELSLVRRILSGGPAVLWDPRPEPHHHFLCSRCGTVSDLDALVDAGPALAAARAAGATPQATELVVHGRCAACA